MRWCLHADFVVEMSCKYSYLFIVILGIGFAQWRYLYSKTKRRNPLSATICGCARELEEKDCRCQGDPTNRSFDAKVSMFFITYNLTKLRTISPRNLYMIDYVKGKKTVTAAAFKTAYDALDSDTRKVRHLLSIY